MNEAFEKWWVKVELPRRQILNGRAMGLVPGMNIKLDAMAIWKAAWDACEALHREEEHAEHLEHVSSRFNDPMDYTYPH